MQLTGGKLRSPIATWESAARSAPNPLRLLTTAGGAMRPQSFMVTRSFNDCVSEI